jgi:tetratricopeptide (TPR) repeat protein
MTESADDLLKRALSAARAGQKADAKQLLIQVIKSNPRSETAWIWMSSVVDTPAERIHCLKQVLAINPANELALKGLQALGALPAPQAATPPLPAPPQPVAAEAPPTPVAQPEPEPAPPEAPPPVEVVAEVEPAAAAPVAPAMAVTAPPREELAIPPLPAFEPLPVPPAPGGVPLISEGVLSRVRGEVAGVMSAIEQEHSLRRLDITWASLETLRKRARGRVDLRPTPMMLIIGASIALVAIVVVLVSQIAGTIRARQIAANTTPSPTPTITLTPVPTVTPHPTRTPTPEGVPLPDEPRLSGADDAPRGDLAFGLTPTAPYVATPHRASPAMEQSIVAFHEGRYQDALDHLEQARARGDDFIDGYYIEAVSLLRLGDTQGAADAIDAGMEADSNFAPLYIAQAELFALEGEAEQARESSARAKEIDPQYVQPYVNLSQYYLDTGDNQAALAEVEAGRAIRKYDVNLLVMASRIYLDSGDLENAAAYANLAYYVDPSSESTSIAVARSRLALGLNSLAVIGLENLLDEVNPSNAEGWGLLGQAYGREGRFEDAQMAYARALQLTDNGPEALAARGLFYLERDQSELAYEDLSVALEAFPQRDEVLKGHAQAAFALGIYDETIEDLAAFREMHEGQRFADVETLYARALVEEGRYEEAVAVANDALAGGGLTLSQSQQGYLLEARARAQYHTGLFGAALLDVDEALAGGGTGTRHYYRALILEGLGDLRQAIRELEWVIFWDATFSYSFGEDAAARLQVLQARLIQESTP